MEEGILSTAYTARLIKQIKELKEELAMRDRLGSGLAGNHATVALPYPDLTPDQLRAVDQQGGRDKSERGLCQSASDPFDHLAWPGQYLRTSRTRASLRPC